MEQSGRITNPSDRSAGHTEGRPRSRTPQDPSERCEAHPDAQDPPGGGWACQEAPEFGIAPVGPSAPSGRVNRDLRARVSGRPTGASFGAQRQPARPRGSARTQRQPARRGPASGPIGIRPAGTLPLSQAHPTPSGPAPPASEVPLRLNANPLAEDLGPIGIRPAGHSPWAKRTPPPQARHHPRPGRRAPPSARTPDAASSGDATPVPQSLVDTQTSPGRPGTPKPPGRPKPRPHPRPTPTPPAPVPVAIATGLPGVPHPSGLSPTEPPPSQPTTPPRRELASASWLAARTAPPSPSAKWAPRRTS